MSVDRLLDEIRMRPSMYVGDPELPIERQMDGVFMILHGYQRALEDHGIPNGDWVRRFADYLRHAGFRTGGLDPLALIVQSTEPKEDAWERFWSLVDDFRRYEETRNT